MVTKWGFSKAMGPLSYGENQDEIFLGRSVSRQREISDTTANTIDKEVREIIERNYVKAKEILQTNIGI
jgi:cell division protease FtsH